MSATTTKAYLIYLSHAMKFAEMAGRCEGCKVVMNEIPNKRTPQEQYNFIEVLQKELAQEICTAGAGLVKEVK